MKILVTGPNGFIAKNLIQSLLIDSKNEVITLGREVEIASLPEFFQKHKPEIVIHLATRFLKNHVYSQISEMMESNISFLTSLLECSVQNHVLKFITFGSYYQFPSPASLYAATKAAAEPILDYYAIQKKLSIQILYLYDTFGPSDNREKILNLFIQAAESGEELLLSPGFQKLKLSHIGDVVDAIQVAIKQKSLDATEVNRVSIEPMDVFTLRELAQCVESVFSKKIHAKWGHFPYLPGVQMDPLLPFPRLSGWSPNRTLYQGLIEILKLPPMKK
jgi:CDP-3, 6-dideoxy-D-glycero-L-glycero-4-hexulose-4-reductase